MEDSPTTTWGAVQQDACKQAICREPTGREVLTETILHLEHRVRALKALSNALPLKMDWEADNALRGLVSEWTRL